jgi:Arc/MetJ-type ribon-helix-helix transcriptional regulator
VNSPKISIRLPQKMLDEIDLLIKAEMYETKCDLVRAAIQELLTEKLPKIKKREGAY